MTLTDTAPVMVCSDPEVEVTAIGDFYHNTVKRDLFLLGEMCAGVVGQYGDGWTSAIADECGVSSQTVGNWAHGYLMREAVAKSSQLDFSPLSPTHFWTLWELQRKYGLSMDKCIEYLRDLLQFREKGDKWGSKVLTIIVEAGQEKDGNTPSWDGYYSSRANKAILTWWSLSDLDDEMRDALREAAKLAEKRMNETRLH